MAKQFHAACLVTSWTSDLVAPLSGLAHRTGGQTGTLIAAQTHCSREMPRNRQPDPLACAAHKVSRVRCVIIDPSGRCPAL